MHLIFVGGCERSGTSLVQKLLVSHSRIAGGPELVFTGRIAELYRRMGGRYPSSYASRIAAFYDGERLTEAFRSFLEGFFRPIFERDPDAVYFSEKTPSNLFAAPELLRIFPGARFVHVLRDGRDVLASHHDVRRRFEEAGEPYHHPTFRSPRVCVRWNRAAEKHAALETDPDLGARSHLLRYEELLQEPERVLTGLFSFLELDLETGLLSPEGVPSEELGIPVDGFWTTREMDGRGFDPSRIGRWRRDLPPTRRALANLLMARNLRHFDYPVEGSWLGANRILRAAGLPI